VTARVDPDREAAELQEYLGEAFDLDRLRRYDSQLDREFHEIGDEDAFYRTSEGYLYNLTAFAMTGTKDPYMDVLTGAVPPGARVLDYGCGIGSDGLALLEAGYAVTFADFDNPSTRYLRWRLERRGLEAHVIDLDQGPPAAAAFDLAFAFDVIEHVDDPRAFLGQMERCAALVLVNLLEETHDDQALHHRRLPAREIVREARGRGLLHYRVHHGRSHLILYGPGRAGAARGHLAYAAGRAPARAAGLKRRVSRRLRRGGS
jgi:SAM-dependent methyltransferase